VLGWGGGYSGEKLEPILQEARQSKVVELDRYEPLPACPPCMGMTTALALLGGLQMERVVQLQA